jgi:hypothetical protein
MKEPFLHTGDPRYSKTFYVQICLFTLEKRSEVTIFLPKKGLLSANSRFAVQNDGTYLTRLTSETCSLKM